MLLKNGNYMVKQTIRFDEEIVDAYSKEMANIFGNKSDAYRFAAQYLAMEMEVIDEPPEIGYADNVEKHLGRSSSKFDEEFYDAFATYTQGLVNHDARTAAVGLEMLEDIDDELAKIAEKRLEVID